MSAIDSAEVLQDSVLTSARPVADRVGQHFVILVANAKGGCGKTTLSTSLAGYYASRGRDVTLLDLDPQQSAAHWCRQRQQSGREDIRLLTLPLDSHFHAGKLQEVLRQAAGLLIIDSPAGLSGNALDALLNISRVVLVPMLPSPIDIRAATRFIQAVMLSPANRRRPKRLAVVANRARARTLIYAQLERFLISLKIPFLTTLRDTQLYVRAAGEGSAILELREAEQQDHDAWRTIIEWLEIQRHLSGVIPRL